MPKKLSATTMLLLAGGACLAYWVWKSRQSLNATTSALAAVPLVP